jgi:hypothetical protein
LPAAVRSGGELLASQGDFLLKAPGAVPVVADAFANLFREKDSYPLTDRYFSDLQPAIDVTESAKESYQLKPGEEYTKLGKLGAGVGTVVAALPSILASGGVGTTAPLSQLFVRGAAKYAPIITTKAPTIVANALKNIAGMTPLADPMAANRHQQLIEAGVDPDTARKVMLAEQAGLRAMAALPASLPGKVLTRAVTGALVNVPAGMALRGAENVILGNEYKTQQQPVLDRDAMAVDAILGALFGGVFGGRKGPATGDVKKQPPPLPDDLGAPVDPKSRFEDVATEKDVVDFAKRRLDELLAKGKGSEPTETVTPEGKKITIAGKKSEFITDAEREEIDFLRSNMENPNSVASVYRFRLTDPETKADLQEYRAELEANNITSPDDPRARSLIEMIYRRKQREAERRPGDDVLVRRGILEEIAAGERHPAQAPWVGTSGYVQPKVILGQSPPGFETMTGRPMTRPAINPDDLGALEGFEQARAQPEQIQQVNDLLGIAPDEFRSYTPETQARLIRAASEAAAKNAQRGTLAATQIVPEGESGATDAASTPNVPGERAPFVRSEFEDTSARRQPTEAEIAEMQATPEARKAAIRKKALINNLDSLRKQRDRLVKSDDFDEMQAAWQAGRLRSKEEVELYQKVMQQKDRLDKSISATEDAIYKLEGTSELGSKVASGIGDRPFRMDDTSGLTPEQMKGFRERAEAKAKADFESEMDRLERQWERRRRYRAENEKERNEWQQDQSQAENRYRNAEFSQEGHLQEDGLWRADNFGFVLDKAGAPIKFTNQREAAKWILSKGNKQGSKRQNLEIENHPSGDGFAVHVRDTKEQPKPNAWKGGKELPGPKKKAGDEVGSKGSPDETPPQGDEPLLKPYDEEEIAAREREADARAKAEQDAEARYEADSEREAIKARSEGAAQEFDLTQTEQVDKKTQRIFDKKTEADAQADRDVAAAGEEIPETDTGQFRDQGDAGREGDRVAEEEGEGAAREAAGGARDTGQGAGDARKGAARSPEVARKVDLRKRVSVLESIKGCVTK